MGNIQTNNVPGRLFLLISGTIYILVSMIGLTVAFFDNTETQMPIVMLMCAVYVLMGVLGVLFSNKADKAMVCLVFCAVVLSLQILATVGLFFRPFAFIGTLILSVFYLIGAVMNKRFMKDIEVNIK
jgi:hypothetical protein